MALSLMVVLAMVSAAFFIAPVRADDQATDRVLPDYPNPTNVVFNDIAWNSDTWEYAVAVGTNTNTGDGVVYKYFPSSGWVQIFSESNAHFYGVVYDKDRSYSSDHFFVVGTKDGYVCAYKLWDVQNTMNVLYEDLDPHNAGVPGTTFYGAAMDGNDDSLVAVGEDAGNGAVAAFLDYDNDEAWYYNTTGIRRTTGSSQAMFSAVAWDGYNYVALIVGNDGSSPIAYTYNADSYGALLPISGLPADATAFNGIASNAFGGGYEPTGNHIYETGYYLIAVGSSNYGASTSYGTAWYIKANENGNYSFHRFLTYDNPPIFYDVDIGTGDKSFAIMVGSHGAIFAGYDPELALSNWSDPANVNDIYGVAVKAPHSPGYGLGVGASSSAKISYQISDSSTGITVNTIYPHLNEIDLRNSANSTVLVPNQQLNIGRTYHFFVNGSYALGWENVQIDIYGWYDNGSESTTYNQTEGGNLNFHLRYLPDAGDPYNQPGTWEMLWPMPGDEMDIGASWMEWRDNPANGTVGSRDGQDFYLVSCEIIFGEQVRYAPGDGGWNNAGDRTTVSGAFNDANSWNFNITISDQSNGASQTQYDEFGISAYTEISTSQNPTGAGPPGSTIYLSPDSQVAIRTNLDYYMTVNVTDLSSSSGNSISRSNIEVMNAELEAAFCSQMRGITARMQYLLWRHS